MLMNSKVESFVMVNVKQIAEVRPKSLKHPGENAEVFHRWGVSGLFDYGKASGLNMWQHTSNYLNMMICLSHGSTDIGLRLTEAEMA